MKILMKAVIAAAFGLTAFANAANAALVIGSDVDLVLDDAPNVFMTTLTVGAGDDGDLFGNQFFDTNAGMNGDEFTIRSMGTFTGISFPLDNLMTLTLSGLQFDGGATLTDFVILESIGDAFVSNVTGDSVSISYNDVAIPAAIYFRGQFVTDLDPSEVPLPAAAPLFLGVLGAAGVVSRRRKAKA